ncbi:MAG TPA: hypothetical protein PKV97_00195 [Thauera aminoaromatica]|nr:hypothetical protein [Thauera aminoaromatica]
MSLLSKKLAQLLDKLLARIDYLASYECKITKVNADGTVDLDPFDPRLKPGPQNVELEVPAGFEKVTPKTGSLCMLSFKNGKQDAPFVGFFKLGATFSEIALRADKIKLNGGGAAVARKGDSVGQLTGKTAPGGGAVTFTYTRTGQPPVESPTVALAIDGGNDTVEA